MPTPTDDHPAQRVSPSDRQPDYEGRPTDERSLGELLRELSRETRTLVRQEINLAKAEASEKASAAGKDAAYLGGGGALAYVGLITVVFGLALLLGTAMADWLAFLLVGVAVAVIGYAFAQGGLTALKRTDFSLQRTGETLTEDKQWMKHEMQGTTTRTEHPRPR